MGGTHRGSQLHPLQMWRTTYLTMVLWAMWTVENVPVTAQQMSEGESLAGKAEEEG